MTAHDRPGPPDAAPSSDGADDLALADGSSPGEPLDRLADHCYAELLAMARRARRRASDVVTLDTRGLLHETFLRLADQRQTRWVDRPHFLAAAAGMMRRVLIDHVRRRRAAKRGGARPALTLDEQLCEAGGRDDALLALDEALTRLALASPRLARVVEYRYFAGMTEVETAEVLGVTERTVRRDWAKARGWLHAALVNDL